MTFARFKADWLLFLHPSTRRDRVEFFRGRHGDCHAIGAKPLSGSGTRHRSYLIVPSIFTFSYDRYLARAMRIKETCLSWRKWKKERKKERSVYVNGALFESEMKILEKKIPPSLFRHEITRPVLRGLCASTF